MESKETKLIETENRLAVARGSMWQVGKMGEGSQKVKTPGFKSSSGDIRYNIITIINNTVLYI